MGFLHLEELEKPKPVVKAKREKIVDAPPAERGCDACGLKKVWGQISSPRMPMTGKTTADILVLGEAPGEQEDNQGQVFIGPTGKILRDAIPREHMRRLAFQNSVRCRPTNNRTPTFRETHACSIHLDTDVESLPNLKAVLGAGGVPLSKFFDETTITQVHGARFPIEIAGRTLWYYPILHPSYIAHEQKRSRRDTPATAIFKSDIKRFFENVNHWRDPVIERISEKDVLVATCEEDAQAALDVMVEPLAIDLETNMLRPYPRDSRIITASISDGDVTISFAVDHPELHNPWALAFLLKVAATRRWIAHNASFELSWMMWQAKRAGIDWTPMRFEDTMAQVRLYHQRETLISLAIASRIHLGVNVKKIGNVNAARINDYSLAQVLPYNGLDSLASAKIFRKLDGVVNKTHYNSLIDRIESCTVMEFHGLPVSRPAAQALKNEWEDKIIAAKLSARKIYEVKQYEQAKQVEFNIGSNDQIAEALTTYGRVKLPKKESGKYVVDEGTLNKADPDNPLIKLVLEYRGAVKMVSTYIDVFLDVDKNCEDGMIHPGYTVMLTATYRLSSDNPNIQNIPKRKHREVRRQIEAPDGHVLVSFDFAQLEFRIYGCASQDRKLCKYIIDGRDLHSDWLDRILNKYYPEYLDRLADKTNQTDPIKIRKYGRDIIKSDLTFACLYGSVAEGIAARTEIPLYITKDIVEDFWAEFPEAYQWNKMQRTTYLKSGQIWTLTGKVRNAIIGGNEFINTPMQSTAADVVLEAQTALYKLSKQENDIYLCPRINVHDDLTFILPSDDDDRLYAYIDRIGREMVKPRFDWQIVPLSVEAKIGKNWCDMEEIAVIQGGYFK